MNHLDRLKQHCELRLAQNKDKEHWSTLTQNYLYNKLIKATHKVNNKLCPNKHNEVLDEIADLVNYAGFIYDNAYNKAMKERENSDERES